MDHNELRDYLDDNEDEIFQSVSTFYSNVIETNGSDIREIEKTVDASASIQGLCIGAPIEKVNKEISEGDYRIDREITEEEFLISWSLELGMHEDELASDEMSQLFRDFLNEQRDHWSRKIAEYVTNRNYDGEGGRFFYKYDSISVNAISSDVSIEGDIPFVLEPLLSLLQSRSDDFTATAIHEMTHNYIKENSKFRKRTKAIKSLDEAAAQSIDNVFDEKSAPSGRYYEEDYDQDVMQAARQVFLKKIEGKSMPEAVSLIRREAVKAIDKVADGEDPIKALREESDKRSRIVRIASYATKRMADDVIKDLAIIGIEKPYHKFADEEQSRNRINEIIEIRGDVDKVKKASKRLNKLLKEGKISQDLREPTERLSRDSAKIYELVRQRYQDEIEDDTSFLDKIFGEPIWTEPADYTDDELIDYMDGILYRYKNLVEEAASRARKMESATETIHGEGEQLIQEYRNQEARKNVKLIVQETEKIHEEIDQVRQNLEEADKMAQIGLNKIEELREDE